MTKKMMIGGVAVVAAVAVAGSLFAQGKNAPVGLPVDTTMLTPMALSNTVSLTGVVESAEGRKVYSTLTYPIDQVNVEVGDTVKAGDILCTLESDSLQLDIAQQETAIATERARNQLQIEMSQKAYENAKENYENGLDSSIISAESGVDQAKAGVDQAKAGVDQAESALEQAEDALVAAKSAVNNAKENYRIAQSQANGNEDDAWQALNDAKAALSQAQKDYNSAVSNIPSTVAELEQSFQQIQADYDEAYRLQQLDLQDIEDEISRHNEIIADKNNELLNNAELTPEQKEQIRQEIEQERENIRNAESRKKQMLQDFSAVQERYAQAKSANESAIASVQAQASSAAGSVSSAQAQKNSAQSAYNSASDAARGSSMNSLDQSIDSARRSKDSTETQLSAAEKSIAHAEKQVETAEKQVEAAEKQKAATENALQQQLDTLRDQIRSSQVSAQSTAAQEIALKKLQDTLNDTIIKAPVDGTITACYAKQGEAGQGLLFVIEDTESLKITTKVKEYDIANVKEGMKTIIKTDATGDKEILGEVSKIDPVAVKSERGDTQSGSSVEFPTEISVSDRDSGIRIGMSTRLNIVLEEKENVFGVPFDAIQTKPDGTSVVYTTEAGEKDTFIAKEIPVTVGMETDFYVEVSGADLKEGMNIISDATGITTGQAVILSVNPMMAAAGGDSATAAMTMAG